MQHKHLLALLQTNFTTIQVIFEDFVANPAPQPVWQPVPGSQPAWAPAAPSVGNAAPTSSGSWAQAPMAPPLPSSNRSATSGKPNQFYTYKCPLDVAVRVGSKVVVDTPRNGLRVVTVAGVDAEARLDLDNPVDYKWIVQVLDTDAYHARDTAEAEFKGVMQEVERLRQRELLLATFNTHLPAGSTARARFDAALALINPAAAKELAEQAAPAPTVQQMSPEQAAAAYAAQQAEINALKTQLNAQAPAPNAAQD
jgi:hypothetical protein